MVIERSWSNIRYMFSCLLAFIPPKPPMQSQQLDRRKHPQAAPYYFLPLPFSRRRIIRPWAWIFPNYRLYICASLLRRGCPLTTLGKSRTIGTSGMSRYVMLESGVTVIRTSVDILFDPGHVGSRTWNVTCPVDKRQARRPGNQRSCMDWQVLPLGSIQGCGSSFAVCSSSETSCRRRTGSFSR